MVFFYIKNVQELKREFAFLVVILFMNLCICILNIEKATIFRFTNQIKSTNQIKWYFSARGLIFPSFSNDKFGTIQRFMGSRKHICYDCIQ
jgi:hypothetical protein